MSKKKIILICTILSVVILGGFFIYKQSTQKYETTITTIEKVNKTYILERETEDYTPMIILNNEEMKISLSSTQYLIGTYKLNEDGLLTFQLKENATNLKNEKVNNLLFEQTENSLISLKEIGTFVKKNDVFSS